MILRKKRYAYLVNWKPRKFRNYTQGWHSGSHGTGFPILNGSNVSHGCLRIDNDDIETFYKIAHNHGANTKVIISN